MSRFRRYPPAPYAGAADGSRPAVMPVSLILGGVVYVACADWHAGALSLRAFTKAGEPRNRYDSPMPMIVSRCLTIDSIGEVRA